MALRREWVRLSLHAGSNPTTTWHPGAEAKSPSIRLMQGGVWAAELPAYRFYEAVLNGRRVHKVLLHLGGCDRKDGELRHRQ